jgi:periplasmic divalent cation tolerance protein
MAFCVVVTTIDSETKAKEIGQAALAAKLAACVQILPIRSLYEWNGELRDEPELMVQMKARAEDYDALAAAIRVLHSYDVPEILRFDIAEGEPAYLDWVARTTARGRE